MASTWGLRNARLLQPNVGIVGTSLLVRDGRIAALDPLPAEAEGVPFEDGGGRLMTPGLIDLHTHGIGHHAFEASPEALTAGLAMLPGFGVTSVLPTLYRVMDRDSLPRLEDLAAALPRASGANAPGFHLEGPFLALAGAGAATLRGDVGLLEEVLAAAMGQVTAMSISPDTPNIGPVIDRLVERRIRVFITHTRATVDQSLDAIKRGARHATHFYDVFPLPPETDPGVRPVGVVEAALADPRVSVDFIGDGVHVHPVAIRAALAAKGATGVVLITDGNIGAGLPAGVYDTPWDFAVRTEGGRAARIHAPGTDRDGGLAGSDLTMDVGVGNLLEWLDLPPAEVWALATSTPAAVSGLTGKGVIEVGADADLVLWEDGDRRPRALRTWVGGTRVFDASDAPVTARA